MKSFILKIMSVLLLATFVACGNGTNTGNPTPPDGDCADCGPSDEETVCESSGGTLLSETECECPDDSVIDPDEECPTDSITESGFGILIITDHGAVVPDPIRKSLIISGDGDVSYSARYETSRVMVSEWDNQLSVDDLEELSLLIEEAHLQEQSNILPPSNDVCAGGGSIDVAFTSDELDDDLGTDFFISGGVRCNPDWIPDEINNLLDKINEIKVKYRK